MIQPDEIIRSHRKTLSISIDARGRLIVRAPKSCGKERIFAFLTQKEAWIRRKQAERKNVAIPLPATELDGYAFPVLGKTVTVAYTPKKSVAFDGERVYVPAEKAQERLVCWLKAQAKACFTELAEKYAAKMGVAYKSLTVASARTRWGTCSHDNALRFSFRLLFTPIEIVEYVVAHELAHTKYKNHSPLFWREVERYVPDYKNRRKWLKLHGAYMEIF